jgi:hypothetical protein
MTFTKTLYTDETFSFEGLENINFDRYITDNGNQYGYYDIDLYLLPVIKGKQYIFSYYSYTRWEGFQSREFQIRYSFGETCYFGILPSLPYDKNGIEYPANVRRHYHTFTANSSFEKIKIRLINKLLVKDSFGCKTSDGEEPYLFPNGYAAYFYSYGFQLEEYIDIDNPSDYSPANVESNQKDILANTPQSFQYFIYKLYGLDGNFSQDGNFKFYREFDTLEKEKRRLDCGSIPCFQTYSDTNPNYFAPNKFNIYKYKNELYGNSNIFKFFRDEIEPYCSNINGDFPKLYTDFEKLYFVGQMYNLDGSKQGTVKYETYEKTDTRYSSAIIEIINLLDKYKNFDKETFVDGDKGYTLPMSFPGVSHTPIKDEDFDNILFTGYLNRPVDLNIQAGFCRYYLNPENPKPKISGYFYETDQFFDVRNTDLIDRFNQVDDIFPSRIGSINKRPSFYISDIRKLNFSRLIKNDSSVNFVKILNYTGYVESCYFKELKTGVSVELTGNYITNRRMSDVWQIQIKNTIDSAINDAELGITDIGVKTWTFQDFGPIKNSTKNSKYLKIVHKNIQIGSFIPTDIATVKLTSTVNGQTYNNSSKIL